MSALVFRSIKHVRDAFSESAFNTDTMACPRGDPIYRVPLLLIISLFMKMPQLLLKRRQVRRGGKKNGGNQFLEIISKMTIIIVQLV